MIIFILGKAVAAIENRRKQPVVVADPIKQYDISDIPVPALKSLKGKKVFTKDGLQKSVRHVEEPVKEHLEVFLFQAEKASNMINKLFS